MASIPAWYSNKIIRISYLAMDDGEATVAFSKYMIRFLGRYEAAFSMSVNSGNEQISETSN